MAIAQSGCIPFGEDAATFGDGAGAGASGTGGGPGGAGCVEVVDSVPLGSAKAFTPSILRVTGGYAVAMLRGGEVWLAMVDEQATVTSQAQVSAAGGKAHTPSLHAVGGGLTVLWAEGSKVLARTMSVGGAQSGAILTLATTGSSEPRPLGASLGDALAVTWMDASGSVAAILDGGVVKQPRTFAGWHPAVAVTAGEIEVAWSAGAKDGPVYAARFDSMTAIHSIAGSASLIKAMVGAGDDFYVAWEDVSGGIEQIGLAKLSSAATPLASTSVAPAGLSANWPALGFDGGRLAVAYYQFRGGPPGIYLTLFDGDLGLLADELQVAENARYPSVAWAGDRVAVAYNVENGPVELSIIQCP